MLCSYCNTAQRELQLLACSYNYNNATLLFF